MTAAKTRADAWGADLPEEARWDLYNLTLPAREGDERRAALGTYEEARAYIADSLRLSPPSRAGWYRFLARMRQELQLKSIYRVAGSCESAKELTREAKIDFAAAADALRARAVDAAMEGDEKSAQVYAAAATAFAAEARKAEELKISLRRIELLEAKSREAKETVADAKLTDAERVAKVRQIFGLKG